MIKIKSHAAEHWNKQYAINILSMSSNLYTTLQRAGKGERLEHGQSPTGDIRTQISERMK